MSAHDSVDRIETRFQCYGENGSMPVTCQISRQTRQHPELRFPDARGSRPGVRVGIREFPWFVIRVFEPCGHYPRAANSSAKLSSCPSGSQIWKNRSPHAASLRDSGFIPVAVNARWSPSTSTTRKTTRPHKLWSYPGFADRLTKASPAFRLLNVALSLPYSNSNPSFC